MHAAAETCKGWYFSCMNEECGAVCIVLRLLFSNVREEKSIPGPKLHTTFDTRLRTLCPSTVTHRLVPPSLVLKLGQHLLSYARRYRKKVFLVICQQQSALFSQSTHNLCHLLCSCFSFALVPAAGAVAKYCLTALECDSSIALNSASSSISSACKCAFKQLSKPSISLKNPPSLFRITNSASSSRSFSSRAFCCVRASFASGLTCLVRACLNCLRCSAVPSSSAAASSSASSARTSSSKEGVARRLVGRRDSEGAKRFVCC